MSIQPLTRIGEPAPDLDEAIAAARTVLAAADRSAPDLDAERCRARLVAVTALATQVAELELHALHLADVVRAGEEAGASSTATWLALQTRQTAKAAHAKARLARALTAQPLVAEAMARGEVLPDQARVILDEVTHLPGDRTAATRRLLDEAAWRSAAELRVEGRRTLRAVDDASLAAGSDGDAATPVAESSDTPAAPAAEGSTAELVLDDEGSTLTCGTFVVPRSVARTLRESLQQLMGPWAPPEPTSEQLGAAFCAFVRLRAPGSTRAAPVVGPRPATTAATASPTVARPNRSWAARLRRPAVRLVGVLRRHLLGAPT